MWLIGDVHGDWGGYLDIIEEFDESVQLGDLGIGFPEYEKHWQENHMFIRGNHDSPELCRSHNNYLGEFGEYQGLFFISGAFSIDYEWRKKYNQMSDQKVWWEDEELSNKDMESALEMYCDTKPNIVISHDAPAIARQKIVGKSNKQYRNRTSDSLMMEMLKCHYPELWVFGHYHCSARFTIKRTRFVCLNILEEFEV